MRRPEFISQSRQRVKRLALQVEERKLQEAFSRERDELFGRLRGPGRLHKPAGTRHRYNIKSAVWLMAAHKTNVFILVFNRLFPNTVSAHAFTKKNNGFRNYLLLEVFIGVILKTGFLVCDPEGIALLRRAVPRKEMIQRSKQ